MSLTCSFYFLKKLSGVRKLTTFYPAKNDHGWVTFISLKTINSDLQARLVVAGKTRAGLLEEQPSLQKGLPIVNVRRSAGRRMLSHPKDNI